MRNSVHAEAVRGLMGMGAMAFMLTMPRPP